MDRRSAGTVIDEVNALGYGLTLGIQTRIDSRALALAARAHIGNCYVNRNMIGAVVGVQPFGGEGLSGTGPKAGGPHYLDRFCAEQTDDQHDGRRRQRAAARIACRVVELPSPRCRSCPGSERF